MQIKTIWGALALGTGALLFSGCGGSGGGSTSDSPAAPPAVADAGGARTGKTTLKPNTAASDALVYLDGSASQGVDFSWSVSGFASTLPTQTAKADSIPAHHFTAVGSRATGFAAAQAGTYTVTLSVGNGEDGNDSSTVQVVLLDDLDGDGLTDHDDTDRDGDGFANSVDLFPDDKAAHGDFDNDGISNFDTRDVDGDGVDDANDAFPLDPTKTRLPQYNETSEPARSNQNDGISVAENAGTVPVQVLGSINASAQRVDIDYFAVQMPAGRYSAIVNGAEPVMRPAISVLRADGRPVASARTNVPSTDGQAAVSVLIPSNDTYYLVVTDASGMSDPAWTYSLQVFADDDLDGVSDDLEIALGSNHLTPDSDFDQIPDFVEINLQLAGGNAFVDDGDRLPLWWDTDADNDGIRDDLEFATKQEYPGLSAAQLAALNDADGDGIANFMDSDSDGNGLPDSQEVGLNPAAPVDTDGDGIADFLDTDDDGDGLFDIHDNDRLVALNPAAPGILGLQGLSNAALDGASICRAGERLTLDGLAGPGGMVVLRSGHSVFNLPADKLGGALGFNCPADIPAGLFDVFYAKNGKRSDSQALVVPNPDAPLLTQASMNANTGTVTLTGENLDARLSIFFNGGSSNASNVRGNPGQVRVSVPAQAASGFVYVNSAQGDSNEVYLRVLRRVPGTVRLPNKAGISMADLDVSSDPLLDATPSNDGSFDSEVAQSADSIVTALYKGPGSSSPRYAPYLQAVCLPDDFSVQLNTLSTATALVWQAIGPDALVAPDNLVAARALLQGLSEVQSLADVIATQLAADPAVLGGYPMNTAIKSAAKPAVIASAQALADALATGNLDAAGKRTPSTVTAKGRFGAPAAVTPAEVDDFKVYERGDSGHINLENDTQLYASAKITSTDGKVLHPHVTGINGMAGPQGYGLIFLASTSEYTQPDGRNATVEIVTAGMDDHFDPQTLGADQADNPWRYLWFRTVIERVVWPVLGELLPLDSSAFAEIAFAHLPNLASIISDAAAGGSTANAAESIMLVLWQDFASTPPGPVTQALAKNYGKDLAEKALAKAAAKISAKFVPGIGQIALAADAAGQLNNGVNFAKAAVDIDTTDRYIKLSVEFPLSIESVEPSKIRPDGKDKTVLIRGSGFSSISRAFGLSTLSPRISFTNDDGLTTTLDPKFTNANGTAMTVVIPGWFLADFDTGTIDVSIRHPNDDAAAVVQAKAAIELINDLELTLISPDQGVPGAKATLYGSGFISLASQNQVTIGGKPALVTQALETSLDIVIPSDLEPGTHAVNVKTTVAGNTTEANNSLSYEVVMGQIQITVCDDGAAKDDAFSLFVNNINQGTMFASDSNFCEVYSPSLAPGIRHTARLLGVEAPDDVGTYSIEFSGVENFTGDALSGNDLVPGVSKFYSFDVPAPTGKLSDKKTTQPLIRPLRPRPEG